MAYQLIKKAKRNCTFVIRKMKEHNKQQAKIPLWIFVALAFGILIGYAVRNVTLKKPVFQLNTKVSELDEVLMYVKERYVDSVDVDKLEDDAIVSALKDLDPHSIFLTKDLVSSSQEQMDGEYEGIGVSFVVIDDTLKVVSPMTGGPSEEVGIHAGDKIITVNDSTIAGVGITNTEIFKLLKGPSGTTVDVGIKRGNRKQLLDFTITRAPIPINSIDIAYMISDNTGYIKINTFSTKTSTEFRVQLDKLIKTGMQSLIIDLRDNGGGSMKAALEILDQLLDSNKTMLIAEGRKYKREQYEAFVKGLFEEGRLAVLIDEGSASASEIVAGAIQDWDRGVIIGRRSFGKGLIQTDYKLSKGDLLRLTIARYYTPSGRSIQRSYENGKDSYYSDFQNRFTSGELLTKDSIHVDSSMIYETLLNKRKVFGGGGIVPDVFVAVDTTGYSDFTTAVFSKRLPSEFVYNYYEKNQSAFESYESASSFENKYFIPNSVYNEFVKFAQKQITDSTFSTEAIQKAKPDLTNYMKALIGRELFNEEGYYVVSNDADETILKALKVLNSSTYSEVLNNTQIELEAAE